MKIKLIRLLTKLIQYITSILEKLTDNQKKIIVYIAIVLGLIAPIYIWIRFTIWCIELVIR
jgi:hypothetical protein